MTDEYVERVRQHRAEKDEFFAEHPHSPIPPDEREGFDGLEYFPPDPDYRFELPLHEHDETEAITVETTADGEQRYERFGEFRFAVDGTDCTLQAFRREDDDGFWVPFRDDTNGEETYPAGRYLDLDPAEDRVDGEWVLDFNDAYNPFCAYSARYECPLIPMDNWLDVRVEAGEKAYEGAHGH